MTNLTNLSIILYSLCAFSFTAIVIAFWVASNDSKKKEEIKVTEKKEMDAWHQKQVEYRKDIEESIKKLDQSLIMVQDLLGIPEEQRNMSIVGVMHLMADEHIKLKKQVEDLLKQQGGEKK